MTKGTARQLYADALIAVSVLLLGSFLVFAGLGLVARWELSAARRQSFGVDDLLGAIAVSAGLAIVAWWVLSVMLAVAMAILARCGRRRAADRAGKCCPAFMRRLAVAAFSVQLLTAPLAQAAVSPAGPVWVPTQDAAVRAEWAPTAPRAAADPSVSVPYASAVPGTPVVTSGTGMANSQATPTPLPRGMESLIREPRAPKKPAHETPASEPQATETPASQITAPEVPATAAPPSAVRPDWIPSAPVGDPGLLAAQPVRAPQDTSPATQVVTVLAGDTLWDIAARHLGPAASDVDIALQWPRWYEANKAQIGESPHVLLPGQILKAPSTV